MLKAVLFDMDGLMINTEPLQSQTYELILKQYHKAPIFYSSGVIQKVGVREDENWKIIKKRYSLKEDIEVLMHKRHEIYHKLLQQNLSAQPGLEKLIQLLHSHRISLAVASSSPKEHILIVLQGLGIEKYFSVIVSGYEVKHSKPSPDIYLEAAKKLNVDTNDCLVLEDAQTGVEAGKTAGAKVIAVPNAFTKDQDFSKADLVIPSLERITWEKIISLFQ